MNNINFSSLFGIVLEKSMKYYYIYMYLLLIYTK